MKSVLVIFLFSISFLTHGSMCSDHFRDGANHFDNGYNFFEDGISFYNRASVAYKTKEYYEACSLFRFAETKFVQSSQAYFGSYTSFEEAHKYCDGENSSIAYENYKISKRNYNTAKNNSDLAFKYKNISCNAYFTDEELEGPSSQLSL